MSTPSSKTLEEALYFYGDVCAQHQSMTHFNKWTVDERNRAIRESARDVLAALEAWSNKRVIEAKLQELENIEVHKQHPKHWVPQRRAVLEAELQSKKGNV